jgi:hypothetical protein
MVNDGFYVFRDRFHNCLKVNNSNSSGHSEILVEVKQVLFSYYQFLSANFAQYLLKFSYLGYGGCGIDTCS